MASSDRKRPPQEKTQKVDLQPTTNKVRAEQLGLFAQGKVQPKSMTQPVKSVGTEQRTMPGFALQIPKPAASTTSIKAPTADVAFGGAVDPSLKPPAGVSRQTYKRILEARERRKREKGKVDWDAEIRAYWGRRRLFGWLYLIALVGSVAAIVIRLDQIYGPANWPLFATWCLAASVMLFGFVGLVVYQYIYD